MSDLDIDGGTKNYGEFIDRTAKLIKIELSRKFKESGVDLTPEQWALLSKLYKNSGQSQSELGDATYKDAPTVSRIVDLLCKKGYAVRKPYEGDRRRFMIVITPEGIATVAKAIPVIQGSRNKGWQGLTDQDYTQLMKIINTISSNIS